MKNHAVAVAVDRAVYRTVNWAVAERGAVALDVAMNRAVYPAGGWAVNRAMDEAVEEAAEPPPPGLGIYLGGVT